MQLLLVLAMAVLASVSAQAQDRPVVFVHGFASTGDTWRGAADRLQPRLAIRAHTPSLSWTTPFEAQGNELQILMGGLEANVVAVGHSNGGLVARQWSRQHPVSGLLTVATPHGGVPLVSNVGSYAGFNSGLIWAVNDVFRAFAQGCCDWQWILTVYSGVWEFAANVAGVSLAQLGNVVAINAALPVTPAMAPGSGFFGSINSPSNLGREAAAIPVRAGVASTAYNFHWGGPIRAVFPDQADQIAYWRDIARFGMDTYAAYIYANAPFEDWWAFEIASRLTTASFYLSAMDDWWCRSVSVVGLGACWLNDTVVPQWSQVYPGGLFIDTGWSGPAHIQATRLSDALIEQVLTHHMAVPVRGAPPPPPPPPSPPPPTGGTSPTGFEHTGFTGQSLVVGGDQSYVGGALNDRLSSIRVPPGRTVVLYEHADYGGASLTLTSDEADLRRHPGPGADGTWNDVASSIRVF